jgi:IS5 family transposase
MTRQNKTEQTDLYSYQERAQELARCPTALDKLDKAIDFEGFRPLLERLLRYGDGSRGGRPPWDEVLMFKIIVLQKYYGLSEEETEFQILDRISFQRFLGLDIHDKVPDKNTVWTFKERLGPEGVRALFERFNALLEARGLMGREGKIVDATFVEVPRQRNSRKENEQIKGGQTPESFQKNPRKLCQKDVDARWAKKGEETHYGYKNHVKVDTATKFIQRHAVTPASTHDSQVAGQLVAEGDGDIFGDSAYSGAPVRRVLEKKQLRSRIHEKWGQARTPLQRQINRLKSSIRARVEHAFAHLSYVMGADRIRTIGIKRARQSIYLGNLIYNFCRYAWFSRATP